MNILVFAHDSSMYGASQSLLTALQGIVKKEDRKVLVVLPNPGKMQVALEALGIECKVISFPRCVGLKTKLNSMTRRLKHTYKYYRKFFGVLPSLNKVILEFKPDVIYTNTSVVSIGYFVA